MSYSSFVFDSIPTPRGDFFIQVFRNGFIEETVCDQNLVVNSGKAILAKLLGGVSDPVTQFGIGSNGQTPLVSDIALTNMYINPLTISSYPTSNSIRFGFQIGQSEANGLSIMEFGLLTTSGQLFSRKVRSSQLIKTSDISLAGSWTITFTV